MRLYSEIVILEQTNSCERNLKYAAQSPWYNVTVNILHTGDDRIIAYAYEFSLLSEYRKERDTCVA